MDSTDDLWVILAQTPHGKRYYAVCRGDETHTVPSEDVVASFGPWLYDATTAELDEVVQASMLYTDYALTADGGWKRDNE